MNRKELVFFNECVDLISDYIFAEEMSIILNKIITLINALKQGNAYHMERLTNEILHSVNFEQEGIPITYKNNRNMSPFMRIRTNCLYIIDRLILFAFKKISEHELDKQIPLSDELSAIYKTMKLDLKLKKQI